MFNSAEYSWIDLKILFAGKEVTGARGLKYTIKQEKEPIYAAGEKAHGMAFGRKQYEGEIRLLQSELEALIVSVGKGRDVMDIHGMDMVVAYAPKNSVTKTVDIIKHLEFTESTKEMKWDDKYQEVTLPFVALDIMFNV